MHRVRDDARHGDKPMRAAVEARISTSAAAPSEMLEALAAVMVPSFLKAGLEARDLVELGLEGLLVVLDQHFAATTGQRHGGHFPVKAAVFIGLLWRGWSTQWRKRLAPRG